MSTLNYGKTDIGSSGIIPVSSHLAATTRFTVGVGTFVPTYIKFYAAKGIGDVDIPYVYVGICNLDGTVIGYWNYTTDITNEYPNGEWKTLTIPSAERPTLSANTTYLIVLKNIYDYNYDCFMCYDINAEKIGGDYTVEWNNLGVTLTTLELDSYPNYDYSMYLQGEFTPSTTFITKIDGFDIIKYNSSDGAYLNTIANSEGSELYKTADTKIWLINGASSIVSTNIYYDTDYYDTFTDSYTNKADKTYNLLQMHVREYDGIIYQFSGWYGGSEKASSEKYSISGNTWSAMTFPTARNHAGSASHPDGYLFRTGGYSFTLENTRYTISSDSWAARTNWPRGKFRGIAGATIDTKFYNFGGQDGTPTRFPYNEEFTDSTNSWANRTEMSVGIALASASSDKENLAYVHGGYTTAYVGSLVQYNYTGNSWTDKTASSYIIGYHSFTHIRNNLSYQIYGYINGSSMTQQNTQYNEDTNAWTTNTSSTETARCYMTEVDATS